MVWVTKFKFQGAESQIFLKIQFDKERQYGFQLNRERISPKMSLFFPSFHQKVENLAL